MSRIDSVDKEQNQSSANEHFQYILEPRVKDSLSAMAAEDANNGKYIYT